MEHARAVGEVNRGGATHGAHDHRARGKGDTRLPHFERHVDWIKARMIDGHGNEASRAVPVARRQNGNRKALDLARGEDHAGFPAGGPTLGEPAEGEFKRAQIVSVVAHPRRWHASGAAQHPSTLHAVGDGGLG